MKLQLPDKLQFLFKPKRTKVMFGGRGGGKTVGITKALLFRAAQQQTRVLCLREYMNSLDESVYSTLEDEISILGMESMYTLYKNRIDSSRGSTFTFDGLARNLASLKSKHGVDIAWVEEAETITQKSLEILVPTIRKAGSELWFSFNPEDEFGPVYSTYVKPHIHAINRDGFYEDEDLYVCKINLDDNPFAPQELIRESQRLREQDYKRWLHVFGGEVDGDYTDSIIQPEWVDAAIDAHVKLGWEPRGVRSLAFDPADTGDDAKALIQRYGTVITNGMQWQYGDIDDAVNLAFNSAEEWRSDILVYDGVGVGTAVKIGLAERLSGKKLTVEEFRGGDSVDFPEDYYQEDVDVRLNAGNFEGKTNRDMFRNKRAQYWWALRDRFEATYNAIEKKVYTDPDGLISLSSDLPDLDSLKSELIRVKRKRGSRSLIQVESKVEMKKRGVKSPNLADALTMCFANPDPVDITPVSNLVFSSEW